MSRSIVHVIARFTAAPGQADALHTLLLSLVEPTRLEAGCIKYELLVNPKDAEDLVFVEEWEDEATLDAHGRSPHLSAARPRFAALTQAPPDVRRYRTA